eukprot:15439581-Alexandrium_andersonii.AAC.1
MQRLLYQQEFAPGPLVEAPRHADVDAAAHDEGRVEGGAGSAMASVAMPPAAAATSPGHSVREDSTWSGEAGAATAEQQTITTSAAGGMAT